MSAAQRKSRKTRGQGIRPFDLPAAKCYTCHNSSLQSTLPLQATELLAPAAVAKCACRHACLATARGNKGTDFGGIQKVRKPWFSRCFRSCVNWKRAFVRLCFMLPVYGLVCGCGYSGEERQRMREIEQRGGEYAARYVREKYGFTPEIRQVTACTERGGGAA